MLIYQRVHVREEWGFSKIFSGHQQHYAIQLFFRTCQWIGFKRGEFTGKPIAFFKILPSGNLT
jgi:hypothetical protein